MMKKGFIAVVLVLTLFVMTACGNRMWFSDGVKNELNYILVSEQNGQTILHTVDKWADTESESAMFTTKCCNNYMWLSANNATFYKNKPTHLAEGSYTECGK